MDGLKNAINNEFIKTLIEYVKETKPHLEEYKRELGVVMKENQDQMIALQAELQDDDLASAERLLIEDQLNELLAEWKTDNQKVDKINTILNAARQLAAMRPHETNNNNADKMKFN